MGGRFAARRMAGWRAAAREAPSGLAGVPPTPWAIGSLTGKVVLSLGLVWILMFLCIFKGVNVVSKVVLWTVPLPWLMLVILMVRGLTLPGATQGLAYYMNPDWSQLAQPTTWREYKSTIPARYSHPSEVAT